jgi:ribosome-interacting GTPase 1
VQVFSSHDEANTSVSQQIYLTFHHPLITIDSKDIEEEMARTQKNKATNYHLGTLKAKLAKLRSELLIEQSGGGGGGGGGEGFDVARLGDARVALIGFPSVGKSTLLSTLTETSSEVADVSFEKYVYHLY